MSGPGVALVAFAGPAGSGKSSAAGALVGQGWQPIKLIGALKAMIAGFYTSAGLDAGQVWQRIEGQLKDTPDPLLGGRTPRFAMQTLGTEWGRDIMAADLWLAAWRARASAILAAGGRVVVDDLRFENEAAAIRQLGGKVVGISGRGGIPGGHRSEAGVAVDMTLDNAGSLAELAGAAVYIFGAGLRE